jgi:hypothetical protein
MSVCHVITCSRISASEPMNLNCSLTLHLMFKYGSSEMACSTRRCGRICAKEWRAVTHPTNLGPLHFSSSIMEFTRPFAICWHDLMSVGEISFLPFVSSFLLSFGSKT